MRGVLLLILLLLIVVFTAQNYEVVEIKMFFWSLSASRAVVLFLTLLIGILIGWLGTRLIPGRKRSHGPDPEKT